MDIFCSWTFALIIVTHFGFNVQKNYISAIFLLKKHLCCDGNFKEGSHLFLFRKKLRGILPLPDTAGAIF